MHIKLDLRKALIVVWHLLGATSKFTTQVQSHPGCPCVRLKHNEAEISMIESHASLSYRIRQ